jgi:hypothetical protein
VVHARSTCNTLVALARHGKARSGARINGGGWAWRNIAGEWRSKHWSGLRSKTTGAQEKGDPGGAHRAWIGSGRDAAGLAASSGGEDGTVFVDGSQACSFGLPGPADRRARSLR